MVLIPWRSLCDPTLTGNEGSCHLEQTQQRKIKEKCTRVKDSSLMTVREGLLFPEWEKWIIKQ